MAKREFIDKNELLDKVQDYGEGQNKLMLIDSYHVRNSHTFTEEDIVKPYLELLLKEMQSLEEINHSDYRYDKGYQHGRASCEAMVMHMIGNLLQGDKEC